MCSLAPQRMFRWCCCYCVDFNGFQGSNLFATIDEHSEHSKCWIVLPLTTNFSEKLDWNLVLPFIEFTQIQAMRLC